MDPDPALPPDVTDMVDDDDASDLTQFDDLGFNPTEFVRRFTEELRQARDEVLAATERTSRWVRQSTERSMSPSPGRVLHSLLTKQKEMIGKVKKKLKEPRNVKIRDKVSFVFGVTNLWATILLFGIRPGYVAPVYLVKLFAFISARLFMYRAKKWHYFMFDMCYFANALLAWNILVPDPNSILFKCGWGLATGPVLLAIPTWGNSLVFHSLDKMTSIFIHLEPSFVYYVMRWRAIGDHGFSPKFHALADAPQMGFWEAFIPALLGYVIWQLAYWVFVWTGRADKIRSGYATSTTWLLADPKSIVYRMTRPVPTGLRPLAFVGLQFMYTILTLLPVSMFHGYKWVHAASIILVIEFALWNGANYYFEVFSRRYVNEIERVERELNATIEASPARTRPPHGSRTVRTDDEREDVRMTAAKRVDSGVAKDGLKVERTENEATNGIQETELSPLEKKDV
ncbi:hypothetical protein M427DRAFT_132779 [Gonapodya prolifera JEL478]|uniref:Glycerophosphocholine acyltransferase 1 n=1 Tax=Gonapodya prolifera (strain JEL478) TaxID=1344416 RepID=A0A139ANV3_GONPJ|nr:hypothetical protein M427DRAFT_132779 [Gonapodya prolifera JEL478]|eukprot:KXS18429.1 hypothetical protein M427DRAFT_132779 [Gonapodya prolifera JEL478]